jgi:hypothetical protein
MRGLRAAILVLVLSCCAFGPTYTINTFAGSGITIGDNGPATNAVLYHPARVAVDVSFNVYIADTSERA